MKRILHTVTGLLALGVLGGATNEAYASYGVMKTMSCGTYNWCAPSEGLDANCSSCCAGPNGGFCYDYREQDNFQGCLCL